MVITVNNHISHPQKNFPLFKHSPFHKSNNRFNFASMAKTKKAAIKKAATTSALAITKKGTDKLSPNQAAFNKLTTRIEKLRKDNERKESQLEEALTLYGQTVPALEDDLVRSRHRLLLLLYPFYKQKKLPKGAQPYLKDMLQDMISEVLRNSPDEPDEELKAIFSELEGEDYETVLKREEKQMQDEVRDELKNGGVEVDWEEDTVLSEEELVKKMNAFQQQIQEKRAEEERRWKAQHQARTKTAKQLQKEQAEGEAEKLKQKNITTIYRQLAKLFHPDLEQEEDRRLEKEALMKQLTEAYEVKNLHALLMLELKWIHNENNHLETLTEEKLGVYLDILRTQAAELEKEKWRIIHQPRFYALVERYGFRPLTYPVKTVKEDIEDIQAEQEELEEAVAAMQSGQAVSHLKDMVQQWKERSKLQQQGAISLDSLMDMLFSGMNKR